MTTFDVVFTLAMGISISLALFLVIAGAAGYVERFIDWMREW